MERSEMTENRKKGYPQKDSTEYDRYVGASREFLHIMEGKVQCTLEALGEDTGQWKPEQLFPE